MTNIFILGIKNGKYDYFYRVTINLDSAFNMIYRAYQI